MADFRAPSRILATNNFSPKSLHPWRRLWPMLSSWSAYWFSNWSDLTLSHQMLTRAGDNPSDRVKTFCVTFSFYVSELKDRPSLGREVNRALTILIHIEHLGDSGMQLGQRKPVRKEREQKPMLITYANNVAENGWVREGDEKRKIFLSINQFGKKPLQINLPHGKTRIAS
jgi:hypothetical protein